MAEKVVNYTDEQAAALLAGYKANPSRETVDAFASKFGKTAKSIIAKLSNMGAYQKPEYRRALYKFNAARTGADNQAHWLPHSVVPDGANSSTCWKVGRLVPRKVSGIKPGSKPDLKASRSQVLGSLPRSAASCCLTSSTTCHSESLQASRSPLPQ